MENLEGLFKKFVYTGVGLVSLTKEKMQKVVNELIDEDKISAKEGKKLVEDFFKNTETKKSELEVQLKSVVEKVVKKFSYATSSEVEELTNRIKVLEDLLEEKK